MARIRTIKPSFFTSDDVSVLPLRARLTWIGLWTHCDDQGRAKDHAKLIKAAVWPLDPVSIADIEEDLATLAEAGRIVRYQAQGVAYLAIVNWDEHQKINHPSPSKIPPPPIDSRNPPVVVPDGSPLERKGREGKGGDARAREAAASRYCPDHPEGTQKPCRACARAREQAKAGRQPQSRIAKHPFADDGSGTCATCSLPSANRAHGSAT